MADTDRFSPAPTLARLRLALRLSMALLSAIVGTALLAGVLGLFELTGIDAIAAHHAAGPGAHAVSA